MTPSLAQDRSQEERERIGEVLGKPVYRDEIATARGVRLNDELIRLFVAPVLGKYRRKHHAEITPTKEELAAATAFFDREHQAQIQAEEPQLRDELKTINDQLDQDGLTDEERQALISERRFLRFKLDPPGRTFAAFMLNNWKWQRHLYDQYGGGRILWQQAGIEAFDAMHAFLQAQEQSGAFKVSDPQLRASLYEYWTRGHGPFLTNDVDLIRTEFLEPEWVKALPPPTPDN